PRIHVFLATSPIHRDSKLMMSKEDVLASIKEHVAYATNYFELVQFSPEDATRTELPFLIECVQTAVDAGASVINIPDTVGFSYPSEYGKIFKTLQEKIKTDHEVIYSAHCHDDLAYATNYFELVQFSPEDATRTELPFLIECVQTAVDAGASVINIPDTVGFSYPSEYGKIFKTLQEKIKTDHEVIYSAHCHDDLG